MKIYSYNEYLLNEQMKLEFEFYDERGKELQPKDFKKVQFLSDSYDIMGEYGFKFIVCHSLFQLITPESLEKFDPSLPTLNFGLNSHVQEMIDSGLLKPSHLYNKPKDKKSSSSKELFHKMMDGEDFVPKTVFAVKDAAKLKFPIIAKPSSGHSGIGITKFASKKELESSKDLDKFDLFSEAIEIETEVRTVFLNDEIVSFMLREPMDQKSKFLQGKSDSIGDQDASSKLNFRYHIHLPEEIYAKPDFILSSVEKMKEFKSILQKIRKKIPLEFLTLDVAIDKNKKLWVIEINTEPGSSGVMLANVYREIFKDFYKRDMDETSLKCLKDVEMKLLNFTLKNEKYRLSSKFIEKYIR